MLPDEAPRVNQCGIIASIEASVGGTSWVTLFSPIEDYPIKNILFFADNLDPELMGQLASMETFVSREGLHRFVAHQRIKTPQSLAEVQLPFYNYRQLLVQAAMQYKSR